MSGWSTRPVADGDAVAGDHLQDARREDLLRELGEAQRRERRLLGGLEDLDVARRERGAQLPDDHHQRVVPGRDPGHDPERLAADERRVALDVLGRGLALERAGRAGEEAEVVGRERHLVGRDRHRLADVQRLELRELVRVLVDHVRELQEQLHPVLRRLVEPVGERLPRRVDGPVDVRLRALRHLGDRLAGRGVEDLHRLALDGVDPLAPDEVLVRLHRDAHPALRSRHPGQPSPWAKRDSTCLGGHKAPARFAVVDIEPAVPSRHRSRRRRRVDGGGTMATDTARHARGAGVRRRHPRRSPRSGARRERSCSATRGSSASRSGAGALAGRAPRRRPRRPHRRRRRGARRPRAADRLRQAGVVAEVTRRPRASADAAGRTATTGTTGRSPSAAASSSTRATPPSASSPSRSASISTTSSPTKAASRRTGSTARATPTTRRRATSRRRGRRSTRTSPPRATRRPTSSRPRAGASSTRCRSSTGSRRRSRAGSPRRSASCSTSRTPSSTAGSRASELAQPPLPARLLRPGEPADLRPVEREVPRARRQRPDPARARGAPRRPDHDRLRARLDQTDRGRPLGARVPAGPRDEGGHRRPGRARPPLRDHAAIRRLPARRLRRAEGARRSASRAWARTRSSTSSSAAARGGRCATTARRSPTAATRTPGRSRGAARGVRDPGQLHRRRHRRDVRHGHARVRAQQFLEQVEPVLPGSSRPGTARRRSSSGPTTSGRKARTRTGRSASTRRSPGSRASRRGTCHFAGEHTSIDFQGYLNGAVETGERAAAEILADLK